MFNFKPKKVFEKINKMDRKQAYTIGAIAVVLIIALLMLISAATSGDDDSFAGMKARGYDLAQMPFATDEAEKFLLANAYPDMKENGSTLLYSAAEKEQRQEEDAQAAEEASAEDEDVASSSDDDQYASGSSGRGYGGYGGGAGRGKTEVGQLSSTGMASAGGSGVNSTWGPSGDFRQFKGREDRGKEGPVGLMNARREMAQFRAGSVAAARINENKMRNTGKAIFGGDIKGSDAFGKDGSVDLSKLQSGGLSLDTSAPATTTDLSNLDKKLADAAKKAEDDNNKDNDKKEWWEEMLIGLAKSAAETLVNSFMSSVGDTIKGVVNGNAASRAARKEYAYSQAGKSYSDLSPEDRAAWKNANPGVNTEESWERASLKDKVSAIKKGSAAHAYAAPIKVETMSKYTNTTTTQLGKGKDDDTGYCTPADEAACEKSNKTAKVVGRRCVCQ